MLNNDILKRMRYILDFDDSKMIGTFNLVGKTVTRSEISQWLKKEEDEDYAICSDIILSTFLNGVIIQKRGAREGVTLQHETEISNNLALKKLKVAFNLKSDDILKILELADFKVGKHELSAFFRKPGHKNYRECKSQILRNFLMGLQLQERKKDKPE